MSKIIFLLFAVIATIQTILLVYMQSEGHKINWIGFVMVLGSLGVMGFARISMAQDAKIINKELSK